MDSKCFTVVFSCLIATVRSQLFQQEPYDYCDPKLKLCEVFTDHTMCKYPVPGLSPQCTKGLHEPLSSAEKDRIMYWHNKFRSYVANGTEKSKAKKLPTSSNMRQMYWDGELETIATRWAEQCTSMASPDVYDKCRNTKRFRVSQNVGTRRVNGTSIDKQAPQIVITWYKENKDFDPVLVDKFVPADNDKVSVKQFANIIWADTYAIGCARVIFQEKLPLADRESKPTIWTTERLVCNYGPAGNEAGKRIYKRGTPCENCPSGTECSRIFTGLCAIQSANKTEENREPKDNENPETKIPPKVKESTTESSVRRGDIEAETETEVETETEMEVETEISPATKPESEDDEEEEEDDDDDYKNCREGECYKKFPENPLNNLNNLLKFPKPTGAKYFIKTGIYLNGKCHCSDIQRSRGGRVRRSPPPFTSFLCLLIGSRFTNLLSYF